MLLQRPLRRSVEVHCTYVCNLGLDCRRYMPSLTPPASSRSPASSWKKQLICGLVVVAADISFCSQDPHSANFPWPTRCRPRLLTGRRHPPASSYNSATQITPGHCPAMGSCVVDCASGPRREPPQANEESQAPTKKKPTCRSEQKWILATEAVAALCAA